MLNPNWIKFGEDVIKKDIADWKKVLGTLPAVYPFQFQIINRLLDRYYRTEKGNSLNPNSVKVTRLTAKIEMLYRAMDSLEIAMASEQRERARQWEEQSDREKDPIDLMLRDEEIRKNMEEIASISCRHIKTAAEDIKMANLGRLWLAPDGHKVYPVSKSLQHPDWMHHHLMLLTEEEKLSAQKHKDDPDYLNELAEMLFKDGWIRISGFACQMYSSEGLKKLAGFLRRHINPMSKGNSIQIVFNNGDESKTMTIESLIDDYDNSRDRRMASLRISSRELLPGGLASGMSEENFDPMELAMGTWDEAEEHVDPDKVGHDVAKKIGQEIAEDHLAKDPHYYSKEKKSKASVPNPIRQNFDYGQEWQSRLAELDKIPNDSNWQNQVQRVEIVKKWNLDDNAWADARFL